MKQATLKWSLISLLILVLAIPAFSQPDMGSRKHMAQSEQFAENLKLTPDQQTQMEGLRYSHEKAMINLQATLKTEMLEVKQLKLADEPNRKKIFAQIDKVGAARIAIEKAKADHQLEVRKILSEEQYKVFRMKMQRKSEFGERGQGQQCKGERRHDRSPRK